MRKINLPMLCGVLLVSFACQNKEGQLVQTIPQPGKTSFNQVVAQTVAVSTDGNLDDTSYPVPGEQAEDQAPAPLEGTVEHQITTVATCHPGEVDLARIALREPGAKGLLLSMEFVRVIRDDQGNWDIGNTVLGSAPIALGEISFHANGQIVVPVKSTRAMFKNLHLTIPDALVKKGIFNASLFLCVDVNQDGSCADEVVSSLNEIIQRANALTLANNIFTLGFMPQINAALLGYEPGVLVYTPVEVTVQDGQILVKNAVGGFYAASATQAALDAAGKAVSGALNNLAAKCATEMTVAEQTPDPTCVPQVRTNGCFVKGTRIALAGGKELPVEQIRKGMEVLTASGQPSEVKRVVAGPEKHPVITIQTQDQKSVTVTRFHPVMTRRGLRMASELTATDEILTESKSYAGLASLRFSAHEGDVYNLELSGEPEAGHLLRAQGLVLGDLFLQEKMSVKMMSASK